MQQPMQINPNKLTTADFFFGKTLGEGAYARVVHAKMKAYNLNEFAIKIMEKNHIKKENKVKYVMMEKTVLAKLTHPFIIRLFYTFQDNTNLYMCMELVPGGELLQLILQKRKENEKAGNLGVACSLSMTQFYVAEIAEAIEYMHNENIIHRDLKPENILIAATGNVKVADFGTAMIMRNRSVSEVSSVGISSAPDSNAIEEDERSSFVGTAEYVSPEILQDREVTPAADLWAIGCITYQMLHGKPPFRGDSEYLTFQNIISHCDQTSPLLLPPCIEKNVISKQFIQQLLQPVAGDRYFKTASNTSTNSNSNYSIKGCSFFDGIQFSDLQSAVPPFVPDKSTFPPSDNMFDGSSDDWQMGVEPTLLQQSKRSAEDDDDDETIGIISEGMKKTQVGTAAIGAGIGSNYSSNSSRYSNFATFEKEKWKQFLAEGEHQILSGTVYKRKVSGECS